MTRRAEAAARLAQSGYALLPQARPTAPPAPALGGTRTATTRSGSLTRDRATPRIYQVERASKPIGNSLSLALKLSKRPRPPQPSDARCALISANSPSPRPCFSGRCRNFRIVTSPKATPRPAAPPSAPDPRTDAPTPPRRADPPSPDRSGRGTAARSAPAASSAADRAGDRSPPSGRTVRCAFQAAPRDQPVHLLQKDLAPRSAFGAFRIVFQSRERRLFHGNPADP